MKLINYIRGERKGPDAHSLEKEAMRDPFLQEALEGFDAVDDDHMARLAEIKRQIGQTSPRTGRVQFVWKIAIAASIVIVALVGKDLLTSSIDTGLQAQNVMERPMDIYVPQTFYEENIAIIASINTELTKDLSVVTDKSRNRDNEEQSSADLAPEKNEVMPLDILVPEK